MSSATLIINQNPDISVIYSKIHDNAFQQILTKVNPQSLRINCQIANQKRNDLVAAAEKDQKTTRSLLQQIQRRNNQLGFSTDFQKTFKNNSQKTTVDSYNYNATPIVIGKQKYVTNENENKNNQINNYFTDTQQFYKNLIQYSEIKNVADIKIIAQLIAQQDASFLKQCFGAIKRKIKPLFETPQIWQRNKYLYAFQLHNLMRLLYTEIEQYPDCRNLFPDWLPLKSMYMRVTKIRKFKEVQYFQYPQSQTRKNAKKRNKILQEYQKKYKMVDPIIMGEEGPQPIARYVVKNFPKTKGWKQIFMALQRALRIEEEQLEFMKNIHDERHFPKDFLCCSQFYYEGLDLFNPWIDSYNDIDIVDSSQKGTQVDIKQKVVSMLNGRGGLIFFDVFENLTETICQGVVLSQGSKQQTTQKIMAYLQGISPLIEINKHYSFEWIPIVQNPTRFFSQQRQKNQLYRKREFRAGRFVLRMKVFSSTQPWITYHYTIGQTTSFFKRNQSHKKQELKGHQIYNFMKERFFENQEVKYQHKHQFHAQAAPDMGHRLYGNQYQPIAIQPSGPSKIYKFHSLIVVDKTNKHKVSQALDQQKVAHQIQQAFPQYGFRLTSTTWILHHNLKFDKVKAYIANKNLKYANNSKQVMLISTTKSVQTVYLDQGGINNLDAWLKGRFPEQQLKYQKKQHDYFLSTKTIMGSIFMYMLLDNFQIRAMFKKIPDNASNRIPKARDDD